MHVSTPQKMRCVCLYTHQSAELSSNRLAQVAQKACRHPADASKSPKGAIKDRYTPKNGKIWHPKKEKRHAPPPMLPFCLCIKSPRMAENGNYRKGNAFSSLISAFAWVLCAPCRGGCFPQMAPFFRLYCLFFFCFLLFGMLFINFRLLRHLLSLKRSNF